MSARADRGNFSHANGEIAISEVGIPERCDALHNGAETETLLERCALIGPSKLYRRKTLINEQVAFLR